MAVEKLQLFKCGLSSKKRDLGEKNSPNVIFIRVLL